MSLLPTLYNSILLFIILYYYLLLFTTLYNSRLFSTTLATTTITTAGGHGKQCWWGPYMPLLSTILLVGIQCKMLCRRGGRTCLLGAMASNAGGVHACHYYLLSTTLYNSMQLFTILCNYLLLFTTHYYYYCWWPWQAMLVGSIHATRKP
jgi:hypothetical protein